MDNAKPKTNLLKNLMYLIIIGFFGWVVYQNIDDYQVLLNTLQNANLIVLGYTVLLGIGNLATYSFIFRRSFTIISNQSEFPALFKKTLIFLFLSISTPLGVTGGSAYLTQYLISRGISHVRAIFGLMISNLAVNISYLFILAITIIYLSGIGKLEGYQEAAAFIILLLNLGILIPLLLFTVLPSISSKIATFLGSILNMLSKTFLRKEILKPQTLQEYITEIVLISQRFDRNIANFATTLPISITYHCINILTLFGAFYAFGITMSALQAFALYGIIYLFVVVSPTPYGIGIVEGLAHSAAVAMGLNEPISLVAILTYRICVLWLPAIIGLFTLRRAKAH